MRINNNLMAMNTHRQLGLSNAQGAKSMSKLSSGLRINSAADDAAGLSISEKMRAQIRGLNQASRNAQDAISMIQTAEGALGETHAILQRMRELAVQSATDTNTSIDRQEIQKEVDELAKEITRISNNTEFNTQKLINGAISEGGLGPVKFHVGANAAQDISVSISAMDAKTLGVSRDLAIAATGTVSGSNIDQVSFGTNLGIGIANGAVVNFSFTPGVAGNAGTQSVLNATTEFTPDATELSGSDNAISFTVGTATYTIDHAEIATWWADQTAEGAVSMLGNASDGSGKLSDVADVQYDQLSNKLSITLKDKGATPLDIAITGTDASTIADVLGFSVSQIGVTGQDVVAAKPATVTLTSSYGHEQTVAVNPDASQLTIDNGNFEGMTIVLGSGKKLSDIISGDSVTIATESAVASAAIFANGSLVQEATTEAGIDVSTQSTASVAITTIQKAIETVSSERSKMGAVQNRLEHTIRNLDTSAENLQASESRIRDVDMAKEMMEFTKQNILQQAATAMLAQANNAPQAVLQLLR